MKLTQTEFKKLAIPVPFPETTDPDGEEIVVVVIQKKKLAAIEALLPGRWVRFTCEPCGGQGLVGEDQGANVLAVLSCLDCEGTGGISAWMPE